MELVRNSWFLVLGSWFLVLGSWFLVLGSWFFILADDLGWTDTGTYGSKYYETPNIDKLATQGLELTSYHNCQNCQNCQPSRAALEGAG